MSASKSQLDSNLSTDNNFSDQNIDKNEYIKSLEISVQLLQREIESLRSQLTDSRVKDDAEKNSVDTNPYLLLSGHQTRKELIEALDRHLDKKFNLLENSIFEFDHNSNIVPYYYIHNLATFYSMVNNLEEDGIIKWAEDSSEIQIIPNLEESSENTNIFTVIYYIKIKGLRDSVFVGKTTKSKEDFSGEELTSLAETISASAVLLDNIISKEEIKKINASIATESSLDQNSSSAFDIATSVIENIYQSLGVIDANVKMIESGIGNSSRRVELINQNSNIIRETGKKYLDILSNSSKQIESKKLKELIADVLFLVRSQLLRDGIKIIDNIDEEIIIEQNHSAIEKSFLNLLLIIRDTVRDGVLINISANKKNNKKIIKFADNGIGFPIEAVENFNEGNQISGEQSEVFDRINQLRSFLRSINCDLDISSQERSGTTYSVYILN